MDTLLHPNADIGENLPSTLNWKCDQSKHISHVVIGDSQPGGSWHSMKGEIQSLSLGSWLELPQYSFQEWTTQNVGDRSCDVSSKRVTLGSVAKYYEDYVIEMGLQENMMNGVRVTKAIKCPSRVVCTIGSPKSCASPSSKLPPRPFKMHPCDLPMHTVDSGLILSERGGSSDPDTLSNYSCSSDSEDDGICCNNAAEKVLHDYKWCLKGTGKQGDVIVRAKNLVLACGIGDSPRQLGVGGEDAPFVCHRFSDFCQKLESIDPCYPVVIVGGGLSAADAVLLCLSKGHKVAHIFHQDAKDSSLIYNKMPQAIYPEYGRLLKLMNNEEQNEFYTAVSQSRVCEFTYGNCCTYKDNKEKTTTIPISLAGVFIGSETNLDFLPTRIGLQLAIDPFHPINAKTNPMDVDPITFESELFPSLYALGPLAGDHFVRFVLGSGLGVCRHLVDKLF